MSCQTQVLGTYISSHHNPTTYSLATLCTTTTTTPVAVFKGLSSWMMEGKVIAVTGLSGIGLAVAKQLFEAGAQLSIADISQAALDNAEKQLGGPSDRLLKTVVDIGDKTQVNGWIRSTVERFGRLDGAANMAGTIGRHHGIRELKNQDDDEWDFIMRINLTGLMYCLRAQLQNMSAGSIVNAASIQGIRGFASHAAYSTSKHAVVGLTQCAAKENAPHIRVNAVAPGAIETPLQKTAMEIRQGTEEKIDSVIQRLGTADEVASVVVFLLSPTSSYVTGAIYSVDGGWNC